MKLKCRINNIEYDVVQGLPFSEELNETLDSCSLIIPATKKIQDILPYDDVYVYEGEFKGYALNNIPHMAINEEIEFLVAQSEVNPNQFVARTKKWNDNFLDFYTTFNSDIGTESTFFTLNIVRDELRTDTADYTLKKDSTGFYLETDKKGYFYGLKKLYFQTIGDYSYLYIDFTEALNNGTMAEIPVGVYIDANIDWYYIPQVRGFYKHFLADQIPFELINIEDGIYKYKINLFSETKALEKIILPNRNITPSLNIYKRDSVWNLLNHFVDFYSPKIKVTSISQKTNEWHYMKKYKLSPSLENIFKDVYAPEMPFNTPTLKDVLTSLMLTKDMIPYVKDDVIYGLDISKRNGKFESTKDQIVNIQGSRTSENHTEALKRNYSNALSQDFSARNVKFMGFRNSDNALMTIGNMRLEFGFPINKINRIYMCYYKKATLVETNGTKKDIMFLCKQNITPLVIINEKRNILSEDWEKFEDFNPRSVEELAEYKLATIGYSIGDTKISGWGETYSYAKGILGVFDGTKSYIENIFTYMDKFYPYGIYEVGYFKKLYNLETLQEVAFNSSGLNAIITHSDLQGASKLKGLFFEVDYDAFYNGSTVISKDNMPRDRIVSIDNTNSSLPNLEKDGLFLKEKINRFSNEAITIMARYNDISELQELGSVYEDDFVIYHREYSIYDNVIDCIYYATKNYVLKNYYTSVFSKLRPFALATYNESVTRAENKKTYVMLSKENANYEHLTSLDVSIQSNVKNLLLSGVIPSKKPETIGYFANDNKINYGYIKHNGNNFSCDVNAFINGNSMCFNLRPYDNVSMGVKISNIAPEFNEVDTEPKDTYTGSLQEWYMTVDDLETGKAKRMGFYVAHADTDIYNEHMVLDINQNNIDEIYNKLFNLPKLDEDITLTNIIGKDYNVDKENKEVIDMTYQFEYIADDDVLISPVFLKLNDLIATKQKFDETFVVTEDITTEEDIKFHYGVFIGNQDSAVYGRERYPLMAFSISPSRFEKMKNEFQTNTKIDLKSKVILQAIVGILPYDFEYAIEKITNLNDNEIQVSGIKKITFGSQIKKEEFAIKLTKVTSFGTHYPLASFEKEKILLPADRYWFFSADFDFTRGKQDENFPNYYANNRLYEYKDFVNNELQLIDLSSYFKAPFTTTMLDISRGINSGENISAENTIIENVGGVNSTTQIYAKNLFVVLGNEHLKKQMVYDEYSSINDSSFKVRDLFKIDGGQLIITTSLLREYNPKSVQIWFFDETSKSYKFVFGVNLTEQDLNNQYTRIYASVLSSKDDRVYSYESQVEGYIANDLTQTQGQIFERR